jgi:hypothetical protein
MEIEPAPSTSCPTCGAIVCVLADSCWRCERIFASRELWTIYEEPKA